GPERRNPVAMSNLELWSGHATTVPASEPSLSVPPAWAHWSCSASTVSPVRMTTRAIDPAFALTSCPSGISVTSTRADLPGPQTPPRVAVHHVAEGVDDFAADHRAEREHQVADDVQRERDGPRCIGGLPEPKDQRDHEDDQHNDHQRPVDGRHHARVIVGLG